MVAVKLLIVKTQSSLNQGQKDPVKCIDNSSGVGDQVAELTAEGELERCRRFGTAVAEA